MVWLFHQAGVGRGPQWFDVHRVVHHTNTRHPGQLRYVHTRHPRVVQNTNAWLEGAPTVVCPTLMSVCGCLRPGLSECRKQPVSAHVVSHHLFILFLGWHYYLRGTLTNFSGISSVVVPQVATVYRAQEDTSKPLSWNGFALFVCVVSFVH